VQTLIGQGCMRVCMRVCCVLLSPLSRGARGRAGSSGSKPKPFYCMGVISIDVVGAGRKPSTFRKVESGCGMVGAFVWRDRLYSRCHEGWLSSWRGMGLVVPWRFKRQCWRRGTTYINVFVELSLSLSLFLLGFRSAPATQTQTHTPPP
jgi:hypothetical protein